MPKIGTKSALFGYFWARILKSYGHIWNQHPQICLFARFHGNTKMPKFGTKNSWFGYFWARIFENYCHIWNQHLQICLIANFYEERKMFKFGTKNTLFEYFGPKMLYLDILGLKYFKKLLFFLKPAPLNLSNCKILWNNKNAYIWDQKSLIWVFLG